MRCGLSPFPPPGRPFEGDLPGQAGPDIRWRHVLHGRPDAYERPDDSLKLYTPPSYLPSVFWRLHQLEVRRRRE